MLRSYFSTNVKFMRDRKGLSQQQLSEELGMKRSHLSAYENGHTKNPSVEMMAKISEYFKIPLDSFVKQDLKNLTEHKIQEFESRTENDIDGKGLRVVVTTVNHLNEPNIEHVPIKAKAGYLDGYSDEQYIKTLPVFNLPNLSTDRKYRSFPSEGDSMYPFPENSIIVGEYVDNWHALKADVPCVVITKNEGIVFKLVTDNIENNRSMLLRSLNTDYAPYNVRVEDVCEIWRYKCYISDAPPDIISPKDKVESVIFEIQRDIKYLLSKQMR